MARKLKNGDKPGVSPDLEDAEPWLIFFPLQFFYFVFNFVDEASVDLVGSVNTENGQILSGSIHNSNLLLP